MGDGGGIEREALGNTLEMDEGEKERKEGEEKRKEGEERRKEGKEKRKEEERRKEGEEKRKEEEEKRGWLDDQVGLSDCCGSSSSTLSRLWRMIMMRIMVILMIYDNDENHGDFDDS